MAKNDKGKEGTGHDAENTQNDPQSGRALKDNKPSATKDLHVSVGMIIHATPFFNFYLVSGPEGIVGYGETGRMCLAQDSTPSGIRESKAMTPGCRVLLVSGGDLKYPYIIGTLPTPISDDQPLSTRGPDGILQAFVAGMATDDYQDKSILAAKDASSLVNWNNGDLIDALGGDWAMTSDLGVGIIITRLAAILRADESCQLQLHYLDQLARLCAYNYELLTACSERRAMNDEGLWSDVDLWTPYPMEAMGKIVTEDIYEMSEDLVRTEGLKDGEPYGELEPKEDNQTGVWRGRTFRGFLGDFYRESYALPKRVGDVSKYGDVEKDYFGLLETWKGRDGSLVIRSAKSISFYKSCLIPVPVQLYMPDDTDGFKREDAEELDEIQEFPWNRELEERTDSYMAQILDHYAWMTNWYSIQSFEYMKADWQYPDPGAGDDVELNDIQPLGTTFSAETPEYDEEEIDPRSAPVRYYKSWSGFEMLEDGSLIWTDGYGSQFIMSGGNIQLVPQGDIILRPGRNIINMAGHDYVIKAKNAVDITTTESDIRIKADKNLMMMAGAGEEWGGVLIESRALGTPDVDALETAVGSDVRLYGVTIKTADYSDFTIYSGNQVYIRSGAQDIILDANGGEALLQVVASHIEEFTKTGVTQFFGIENFDTGEGSATGYNTFSQSGNTFYNTIMVNGQIVSAEFAEGGSEPGLLVDGLAIMAGSVFTAGSVIAKDSIATDGAVAAKSGTRSDGILHLIDRQDDENFDDISKDLVSTIEDNAKSIREFAEEAVSTASQWIYASSYGQTELRERIGFSLRTDEQYKIDPDTFWLYEAQWQRIFRKSGVGTPWKEEVVLSPTGTETMPWPGVELWRDRKQFGTFETTCYDIPGRKPEDRETIKEDGKTPPESKPEAFDEKYLVTTIE